MENLDLLELKLNSQYMAQAVAMMNAHLKAFNELLRKHNEELSNEYSLAMLENLRSSGSFAAAEASAQELEQQIARLRERQNN